jgi:hypothetical protein
MKLELNYEFKKFRTSYSWILPTKHANCMKIIFDYPVHLILRSELF